MDLKMFERPLILNIYYHMNIATTLEYKEFGAKKVAVK